jgi:hypothetical protein
MHNHARVPVLHNSPLLNRLRMNCDAGNLREMFLHAEFQFAGNLVDLRDRQASVHGAVAGDQDFLLDLANKAVNDSLLCGEEFCCV